MTRSQTQQTASRLAPTTQPRSLQGWKTSVGAALGGADALLKVVMSSPASRPDRPLGRRARKQAQVAANHPLPEVLEPVIPVPAVQSSVEEEPVTLAQVVVAPDAPQVEVDLARRQVRVVGEVVRMDDALLEGRRSPRPGVEAQALTAWRTETKARAERAQARAAELEAEASAQAEALAKAKASKAAEDAERAEANRLRNEAAKAARKTKAKAKRPRQKGKKQK